MGITGSLFKFLLLLHIACAVLGFGGLAFNGYYLVRARRLGGTQAARVLEANADVSRIAEILVYAVFVLGLLLVATSKSAYKFSKGWLSAAMVLYLIDLGVLHGFIRRSQRRFTELSQQVNGSVTLTETGRPAEVSELTQLEQRISLGWAVFDVVFLIVIYLMVFKPGG
jgi:uncharacterized membrane protein